MNGLTRTESAIMALWDEGLPVRRIAGRLGIDRHTVDRIVSSYHSGPEQPRHLAAMAAGSRELARAIAQARG